jgi:hypothetical protein
MTSKQTLLMTNGVELKQNCLSALATQALQDVEEGSSMALACLCVLHRHSPV